MNFIKQEPALVIGAIQAAIVLAVVFGAPINDEQKAAIIVFAAALLSVITRQMVTPTAKAKKGDS